MQITLIDDSDVTLVFHTDSGTVHHTFHCRVIGPRFRHVLSTGLAALREHRGTKWLSDDRDAGAIPEEDVKWSQSDWIPPMIESGWKAWAIVAPHSAAGRLNLQRHASDLHARGIEARLFESAEEALDWLRAQ